MFVIVYILETLQHIFLLHCGLSHDSNDVAYALPLSHEHFLVLKFPSKKTDVGN